MVEDKRESGRADSNVAEIPSGDDTLFTPASLRREERFSIEELKIEYSGDGSTSAVLMLYDEPSDTTSGNEEDLIDKFYIEAGDRINPDMVWAEVEDDLIVTTEGNQDAEITVTVGGFLVTG